MKLDGYTRVSQVRGRSGESFISPKLQREQIEAWAGARGHEIVAWHEDLDQSGGTLQRPGFQDALARIEAGAAEGVVVAKLDRFARSVPKAWEAIQRLQAAGGVFVSVADDIDLSTPSGQLQFNMLAGVAQFERDRIKASWEQSNASAIARGIHFTAIVPFGYVRGDDRRLLPDPNAAPIVVEVFKRRARRESWRQIATFLDDVAPKSGGRAWSPRNVSTMVKSRTYLGEAFHGEHRNPDAHQPLVTLPEWNAANLVTGGPGRTHAEGSLLAGLIRCAGCRYAMRRTFTTYRSGERVEIYSCQVRHTGGVCPAPANVVARLVESVVADRVLLWTGQLAPVPSAAPLEEANRVLDDARARLASFAEDDALAEALGRDAHLAGAARRREAVEAAEARVRELEAQDAAACARAEATFAGRWDDWNREQRRAFLRQCLDTVYVRKGRDPANERVLLRWAGEDVFERPRRGTSDYVVTPIPWPVLGPNDSAADSEMTALASIPGWALSADDVPGLPEDLRARWPRVREQLVAAG